MKVLVPVDGSEKSIKAVRHAIYLAQNSKEATKIYLLNVQLPVTFGDVKKYISQEALDSYYMEEGDKALIDARRELENVAVPYEEAVVVNQIAESIHSFALHKKCDQIIMGTRGLGSFSSLLLGSVASKVIHLTSIPVTLVK